MSNKHYVIGKVDMARPNSRQRKSATIVREQFDNVLDATKEAMDRCFRTGSKWIVYESVKVVETELPPVVVKDLE